MSTKYFDDNGDVVLQKEILTAKPTPEELSEIANAYRNLLHFNSAELIDFERFILTSLQALRVGQGRVSKDSR